MSMLSAIIARHFALFCYLRHFLSKCPLTKQSCHDGAHVVLFVQGDDQLKCDIRDIGGQERDGIGKAEIEHLHNNSYRDFISLIMITSIQFIEIIIHHK